MKSIEHIREEIQQFSKANEYLSYREVEELQHILHEDEMIMNVTTGEIEVYKGLFFATDYRVLFIYYNEINQSKVLEVAYEKLDYFHVKQVNYYVAMELFFSGSKIEITDLPPDDADSFKEILDGIIGFNKTLENNRRAPKKKFGFIRFLLFIGIAVLTGYLVGPQFQVVEVYDEVITNALSKEEGEKTYQIDLSNLELEQNEYETIVKGEIINNSNKEYRYISIDVQFYDKKGSIVDSQIEYIYDLKPGGSWNLETYSISEYSDSYKVVGVYAEAVE